jgi:hypothetical protein
MQQLIKTDNSPLNLQAVLQALQGKTGANQKDRNGGEVWLNDVLLGICWYDENDKGQGRFGKWKLRGIDDIEIKERLEKLEKAVEVLQDQISKQTKGI